MNFDGKSRPAWARGLKQNKNRLHSNGIWSRPAWARGLKPVILNVHSGGFGRAPRGRVD